MGGAGGALRKNRSARAAAKATASTGISSWQSTAPVTPGSRSSPFAPGATTIVFSPSSSTTISATPVVAPRCSTVVTPASRRPASASSANASSPTLPTNVTAAPTSCTGALSGSISGDVNAGPGCDLRNVTSVSGNVKVLSGGSLTIQGSSTITIRGDVTSSKAAFIDIEAG